MWNFGERGSWNWGDRTYLMGILNVTPDSFSDGGDFSTLESALHQAHILVQSGSDVLDIGGQSTRPQADDISLEEELHRVIPVIQSIRKGSEHHPPLTVPISVDTTKAAVAREAIAAGADIINDISGAVYDPDMLPTVAELGVPIILMHMRGTPKTMQQLTQYDDLMGDIYNFLARRIEAALASGISQTHIAIDPGIGFAKTYAQNLKILRELPKLKALGYPILVGPSRKAFIGHILNQPDAKQRVWGTAAACYGAIAGGADILRVHDIREMYDVSRVADAILRG
ncbi:MULTISPECIES: dihydropteroate synthase [unclassified Leptolyngbya]|uniref:dihydropteroate synthase n=1 Tax=unclassified Leptolyngbya TaxID=2650499 RepID=UPI001684B32C|nr:MULTISPECIES: dihydropteroate synthase [unclassified Leptolyngbya]MBD1911945.1 dihydropteroate synthase [Leptolyngbya sp. FACHB-8]MBD2154246.1 dihydropteroate synthase [Leptolyngbya sp. FACHB-16]